MRAHTWNGGERKSECDSIAILHPQVWFPWLALTQHCVFKIIHLLHLLTQHGLWVMHYCPPPYISTMPKTGQVFFVRADFAQTDLDSGPAAGVVSASPLQGLLTILIQGKGSRVAFKAIVSHLHLCVSKCYSLSWKRS